MVSSLLVLSATVAGFNSAEAANVAKIFIGCFLVGLIVIRLLRKQSNPDFRLLLSQAPFSEQMSKIRQNVSGREVQRLRMQQHLSQEAFAAVCQRMGWDISRATLSKIESGIRCVSDKEVILLAAALNCSTQELLRLNHLELL